MQERFTNLAKKVMQFANAEAIRLGHGHVDNVHILLGVLSEDDGIVGGVFGHLKVDLPSLREKAGKIVQSGQEGIFLGKLPLTEQAQKVVDYAIEESRELNLDYVGTESLLLGLLRVEENAAAGVLLEAGVTVHSVRESARDLYSIVGVVPTKSHRIEPGVQELQDEIKGLKAENDQLRGTVRQSIDLKEKYRKETKRLDLFDDKTPLRDVSDEKLAEVGMFDDDSVCWIIVVGEYEINYYGGDADFLSVFEKTQENTLEFDKPTLGQLRHLIAALGG